MKRGPNGAYAEMLSSWEADNGKAYPQPEKKWFQLTPLEQSRWKNVQTLWKRKHNKKENLKMGKWILSIRRRMQMSQTQFAKLMGVKSYTTIFRWETGQGYTPTEARMERLRSLDASLKQIKKEGLKMEGKNHVIRTANKVIRRAQRTGS
jgi:DNA-binding transcriptional regulator YiaG